MRNFTVEISLDYCLASEIVYLFSNAENVSGDARQFVYDHVTSVHCGLVELIFHRNVDPWLEYYP